MTEDITPLLADASEQIEAIAQAAYERTLALIAQGEDPRAAVAAVLASFQGQYAGLLADAFSQVLQRSVLPGEVLALPVGDVALSERLYAHTRQTGNEVAAIVRQHAQGLQQSRALALQLYDGYSAQDGVKRPLEGAARAQLPAALRELTREPGPRQSLQQIYTQLQQQAGRIKSEALKAGYMETLQAWQRGAGQAVLEKRLWVAEREKTRYMANRIAQTELARAHQDQVAAGFMADERIEVVQVRLNPRHPLPDICDLHARADLFGLGPGIYPKTRAPKPPFHPHCFCRLSSRPDLSAQLARERPEAVRAYLKTLEPAQAARVLGSRERLDAVMNGGDWEQVTQASVRPEYRLKRVGENIWPMPQIQTLTNFENAIIPASKLAGYALNPNHESGKNKARVFAAALGFTQENANLLENAIIAGLRDNAASKKHSDKHGQRYEVNMLLTGPSGRATVTTGWIVDAPGGIPRMTSAYVKDKS